MSAVLEDLNEEDTRLLEELQYVAEAYVRDHDCEHGPQLDRSCSVCHAKVVLFRLKERGVPLDA